MWELLKSKSYQILLVLTGVIACVTMLWMHQTFILDSSILQMLPAHTYNSGWSVVNSDTPSETDLVPRSLTTELGTLVISNTLPEQLSDDDVLVYRINDEATRVFVGEEQIFSYGYDIDTPMGSCYGTVWLSVPLHSSMAGQQLRVEITALSDLISNGNYTFYLDQHNAVMATIMLNNAPLILVVLVGVVLATLLLIGGIFSMNSGLHLTQPRIFLALFVYIGQCWVLAQADLFQFFLNNKAVSHFLAHTSLMILPVFFALYLSALLQSHSKQYRWFVSFFSCYLLLRIVLYLLNVLDISAWTSLTHILIALGATYSFSLFMIDKDSKVNPIVRAGVILFFVVAICAIVHYWLIPYLNEDMPYYALILGVGIDTLLVFYYCALLLNHRFLASNRMRFEQQAFTDAMTQVNNRTAFDYIAPTLKPESHPRLTLIMFDLNTLKQVNDSLGHLAGDKLVCALVNYLKLAFEPIGKIYRFGGDEFIVMIENAPLENVQAARTEFDRLILEHSQHGGNEISVAIGMASRQEREFAGLSIETLLNQADKAMYAMKTIMKSRPTHEISTQRIKQIDPLTSILTFDAFKSCVFDALSTGTYAFPCIVTFDLNYFDGYNNLFGWDEGDRLLHKMADMALRLCGDKGFCAHADADHFWVFSDMPDLDSLTRVITEETHAFQNSVKDCMLFPSFGIYCILDRNLPVSNMCSRATSAQKQIKGRLDTLYAVYNTNDHTHRADNIRLLSMMRKAMNDDEFVPYYQPKFSIDGKHLRGAEALVRWPEIESDTSSFIQLFEHSGLILTLDWYMFDKACREIRRLLDKHIACVPISTNFSRLHVYENDCVEHVQQLLQKYRLAPQMVGIEFTSTVIAPDKSMNDRLHVLYGKLRSIGICVTLDDFNSNLSSLANLDQLNADFVKINCALAMDSAEMAPALSAFRFATELCAAHGIRTLIDHVDTREQLELIQSSGCNLVQGNYLSPPLPGINFQSLLLQHQEELSEIMAQFFAKT